MNIQMLLSPLTPIGDFLHWHKRLGAIEGWLHELEAYTLFLLAANGPGIGEIVEIGSYLGRSTAWLAGGTKSVRREKVTAVDHFKGSPQQQAGQIFESKVLVEEKTTLHRFQENLRRVELDDYVTPLVAASDQAAAQWNKPVRLLFIDGDHSYDAAKADFDSWVRFVVPSGLVCFHDIGAAWPGVTQFYQETMRQSTGYRELATVVSLKVIQKVQVLQGAHVPVLPATTDNTA